MHSIMTHACVAKGKKEIAVEQRELKYSDDDVVVQVECGGICGSDIHYYHEGRAGLSVIKQPLVIGHEFVGRIFQAPAASGLEPGQKVAINPSQPCGQCEYCRAGKQNACATMRFMGSAQFTPHVNGGFAQYVVVPAKQCVAYDEQVPASVMAVAEPTAVVIHALNVAGSIVGKRVLVMGAGPIGALAIAAASASGAAEIVAFDPSERCRRIAVEMGADAAVDASDRAAVARYGENRGYFDVTLEASGAEAAIESSILVTRPGGVVVQIGMGKSPLNFPVAQMLVKEISWKGSFRFIDEFDVAVKWLEKGIIDPRPILSGNYAYHDIEAALKAASDKTQHSKVLVQFFINISEPVVITLA